MSSYIVDWLLLIVALLLLLNFGAYSVLLSIIARFRSVEHAIDQNYRPSVTVLIAAFNEEEFLREKLKNTIELEYPEHLFNILVVSDGSTDATNSIAREYEDAGVELLVNPNNVGKATALNTGIEQIATDLVILSDANVMYDKDAVIELVKHFTDPAIGAVSGKVVLVNDGLSYSSSENAYYLVEHKIQQMESSTGNLIGVDGAMYAMRRELCRQLHADTLLDDFVMSMGVIQQGKRVIFDPKAMGYERNLAEMGSEYGRKVRIVAGGMQSLKRGTSWPPRDQLLTRVKMFCHKIVRWLMGPLFLLFVLLLSVRGLFLDGKLAMLLLGLMCFGFAVLGIVHLVAPRLLEIKPIGLLNYLLIMHLASISGCIKGWLNTQQVTWREEP